MTRVIEINDIEALESYRLAWNALFGQTRGASFFLTLDWLQCYWRHHGDGQELRVLVVMDDTKPLGIVPLTVIRERTGVGDMRVLTYPLHAWGWFYGPIGPHPTATLTSAMKHIASSRRDWDILDLRWVDNDRCDKGRTQSAMDNAGFLCSKRVWRQTSIVNISGSWGDYFAGMTPKQRNNLRRYEKRVAQLGDVEYLRHRPLGIRQGDDDPRWDLYDQCVNVASKSWQAGSNKGTTLCDDSVREFLREAYGLAVQSGMAELNLLRAGSRAIAFACNYVLDGYVTGIRFGFDGEFANAGAGNVMYQHMLRDSFERGDRIFDLGVGSLAAKQKWQTAQVNSYRYTHYPFASPRSQILRLKHWWDRRKSSAEQLAS